MNNPDDQRAAFEAWLKSSMVSTERWIDNFGCGPYRYHAVQFAWQTWQAAIEHARKSQQQIMSVEEARKRQCCRVCGEPDAPGAKKGVLVLNYGAEYAHSKCIGGD